MLAVVRTESLASKVAVVLALIDASKSGRRFDLVFVLQLLCGESTALPIQHVGMFLLRNVYAVACPEKIGESFRSRPSESCASRTVLSAKTMSSIATADFTFHRADKYHNKRSGTFPPVDRAALHTTPEDLHH
jgi:hypothetical protein